MLSTLKYVSANIAAERSSALYKATMLRCLPVKGDNILTVKAKIQRQRALSDLLYSNNFREFLLRSKHYANMACDHAMDVIVSVDKRFLTGELPPEYNISNIGGQDEI